MFTKFNVFSSLGYGFGIFNPNLLSTLGRSLNCKLSSMVCESGNLRLQWANNPYTTETQLYTNHERQNHHSLKSSSTF